MRSAPGVAEAAAPVDAVELVDDLPDDLLDALHDELGDAVAAVDRGSRSPGSVLSRITLTSPR